MTERLNVVEVTLLNGKQVQVNKVVVTLDTQKIKEMSIEVFGKEKKIFDSDIEYLIEKYYGVTNYQYDTRNGDLILEIDSTELK
ncbi:hypothetical protein QTG56_24605 (plasmid) [Rossellomorea sp. AcN35-11]|nr:hypothetical protein [Rossellomorea aquimaris]WJV31817.1 hypothetical protein QTG56_24605 [Rossellomorea sp. AcN35-11]